MSEQTTNFKNEAIDEMIKNSETIQASNGKKILVRDKDIYEKFLGLLADPVYESVINKQSIEDGLKKMEDMVAVASDGLEVDACYLELYNNLLDSLRKIEEMNKQAKSRSTISEDSEVKITESEVSIKNETAEIENPIIFGDIENKDTTTIELATPAVSSDNNKEIPNESVSSDNNSLKDIVDVTKDATIPEFKDISPISTVASSLEDLEKDTVNQAFMGTGEPISLEINNIESTTKSASDVEQTITDVPQA